MSVRIRVKPDEKFYLEKVYWQPSHQFLFQNRGTLWIFEVKTEIERRTSSCAISVSFEKQKGAQYVFICVSEPGLFLIFAQHINYFWNPLSTYIPEISSLVCIRMTLTVLYTTEHTVCCKECGNVE